MKAFRLLYLFILSWTTKSVLAQPPVINSISPLFSEVGSIITISGANFSGTNSNNIVRFGAVKTTPVSSTPGSLQVRVPKGASFDYTSVTVLPAGLTVYSIKQFRPVFPGGDSSFSLSSFAEVYMRQVNGGVTVDDFMISDLDDDGRPDMIAQFHPGGSGHDMYFFRNTTLNGQISFANPIIQTYPGSASHGLWVADIDGDGRGDLLTGSYQQLSIHRNTSTPGTISFASPLNLTNILAGEVFFIQVNDLDGDGRPEIVFSNNGAICVFKNQSTPGTISVGNQVILFPAPALNLRDEEVKITDIDGDNLPDLVVTHYYVDSLYIFRNLGIPGTIRFEAPTRYFTGGFIDGPIGLFVGDIDNDNRVDLAFATRDRVNFYKNNSTPGAISLYPMSGLANYYFTNQGVLSDLNGDQKLDLVTNHSFGGASILKSNSAPCNVILEPRVDYLINYGAGDLAVNDLSGDGKPDIVTRHNSGIRVLKNLVGQWTRVCSGANTSIASSLTGTTYQWQQNTGAGFINLTNGANVSGTNTALLQLQNIALAWSGYKYRCVVDTDTSNVYTLSVQAVILPSLTITRCPQFICTGNTATLTATVVNAGNSPAFQWQDSINNISGWTNILGANSATLSNYTAVNGSKVRCVLTSNLNCASPVTVNSNALIMQYFAAVNPSATISGNTTVVAGQSSTITSVITNGGTAPGYQWQDSTATHGWQNINAVQAIINYFPAQTGDKLRLVLASSMFCATPSNLISNTLVFTVSTVTSIDPTPSNVFGIRYFPNPASQILYIDSIKLSDRWQTLQVVDIFGKLLFPEINISNRTIVPINLSKISSGTYVAILRRKNGSSAYIKFIKQ